MGSPPSETPAAADARVEHHGTVLYHLHLDHRPKYKMIPGLAAGLDTVFVLLMTHEGGADLAARWSAAGVEAIHVDYGLQRDGNDGTIEATAALVAERLAAGKRVLIHCSAGLHRTGMVAYESLRQLGLDTDEIVAEITRIRRHTGEAVAEMLRLMPGTSDRPHLGTTEDE